MITEKIPENICPKCGSSNLYDEMGCGDSTCCHAGLECKDCDWRENEDLLDP